MGVLFPSLLFNRSTECFFVDFFFYYFIFLPLCFVHRGCGWGGGKLAERGSKHVDQIRHELEAYQNYLSDRVCSHMKMASNHHA